jgi:signal transduction histidine kinase
VRATPTNIFGNGKIAWVGSNTDIHEQKMFEDQLEKRVKQRTLALEEAYNNLEKTNYNLQQYAHVTSHDLQEPLRKIQTFINLLYENLKDKNAVEKYYDKILSTAQKMSRLILDVNNLTKIDAELIKNDVIDLNEVISEVKNDFELLIAEKKAIFEVDKLPVIRGSKLHIYRLFLDLISNSLKFNKRNPVIRIKSKKLSGEEVSKFQMLDKKKTYFEIVVSDNGIGFDQKHASQIFTMFQQLNVKSEYGGTGMGLALCKKIVENHQGEIFAVSKVNKGTEMHIILPVG